MINNCPICGGQSTFYTRVNGYNYFNCTCCDFIFIELIYINEFDNGNPIVKYSENYWNNELKSSKARAYNNTIARMSELIYYTRISINIVNKDITYRAWTSLEENLKLLDSHNLNTLLKTFGRSQVREFLC